MTFKRVVDVVEVLVLVLALGFAVALFTNDGTAPPTAGAPADGGTGDAVDGGAVDGAAVYQSNCAGCHGSDGSGGVAPALGGGAVVEAYPDAADQVAVITEGRNGMPDFGGNLTPEEIQAVTEYTRNDL